jgi:hypothetical protein
LLLASKAAPPGQAGGLAHASAAPPGTLMEHGADATILFDTTILPRRARSGEDAAAVCKRA